MLFLTFYVQGEFTAFFWPKRLDKSPKPEIVMDRRHYKEDKIQNIKSSHFAA
jgi:hypothetical protein